MSSSWQGAIGYSALNIAILVSSKGCVASAATGMPIRPGTLAAAALNIAGARSSLAYLEEEASKQSAAVFLITLFPRDMRRAYLAASCNFISISDSGFWYAGTTPSIVSFMAVKLPLELGVYEWMDEYENECMYEWMNEWMNERVNEWMNEWINEWTNE